MSKRKGAKNKRAIEEHVKVKKTIVGQGVFARCSFQDDDLIGEVGGKVMFGDFESDYCMQLDDDAVIEPDGPFRFLNHSCMPNTQLESWRHRKVDGRKVPRLWLRATRRIRRGDELTIDYGWPAHHAIPCLCRAKQCRGWIVDVDELADIASWKG